jgi:hypothetical protein
MVNDLLMVNNLLMVSGLLMVSVDVQEAGGRLPVRGREG